MDIVCLTLVAAAVLMYCADLARASCAVALDGDTETVARIELALAAFPDDPTACVALRVICDRRRGEITVELQDELGRSAHRSFASPDGAAAFLISWSRRPLAFDAAALARSTDPPPAEPPPDPLGGEFRFTYLRAVGGEQAATSATAAVVRRDGIWRYGGDLRLVAAPARYDDMLPVLWVASDVEATAGIELGWLDRVRLRGELAGGAGYATLLALSSSSAPSSRTVGVHAGLRASVASRLASAIWLEAGIGWDPVQAYSRRRDPDPLGEPPPDPFGHPLRLEVGLQWAP